MEVDSEDSGDFVPDSGSSGPFAHLAAGVKPQAFGERKTSQAEIIVSEAPADLSKPGPSGMQTSGSAVDIQTATGLQELACASTAASSASGEFLFWRFCIGYETPIHCFICHD
jgi:hypothetical protein